MKGRNVGRTLMGLVMVMLSLIGCSPRETAPRATPVAEARVETSTPIPPTPVLPTETPTPVPPTPTLTPVPPTPTLTPVPPTPTPIGGGGGRIAFVSNRDGNKEIYVMNADGSGGTNLTRHEADDRAPSMSPDGTRIAFVSDRDDNREIYLINADGTGLTRLTDTPEWEWSPAWSPDGTRIAFISDFDVFVMKADGSDQTNLAGDPWADSKPVSLLDGTRMAGADLYATWMPDGRQIVFLSVRDRSFQFYVVNIDGAGLTMLEGGLPPTEFSPDETIVLVPTGVIDYHLASSGGASHTMNDSGLALGELPAWSPDGTRIAFHSDRGGNKDIYVTNVDRSEIVQLMDTMTVDISATWSPDSTRIAFASDLDGNYEIYVMNADGTDRRRLTDNSATDYFPSWHP